MKINKYTLLILAVVVVVNVKIGGAEDFKTTQGTINKTILSISENIDTLIFTVEKGQEAEAPKWADNIGEQWEGLVDIYEKHSSKVSHKSPQDDTILTNISAYLNQVTDLIETGKLKKTIPLFKKIKQLLGTMQRLPILMDFTGFRCKNCKIMKKRLKKISKDFEGKTQIIFINVNKEKKLVKKYKIILIPTLVFLNKNKKEVYRKVGVMEEKKIREKLEKLIKE